MATEAHNKSLTDLLPDTLIELFEVEVGGTMGIKKFHAGKIIDNGHGKILMVLSSLLGGIFLILLSLIYSFIKIVPIIS